MLTSDMNRPRLAALVVLMLLAAIGADSCRAQIAQTGSDDWEDLFYRVIEEEDIETDDYEEAFDVVSDLAQHRLNVNSATRDDWQRLPFLSEQDIERLCEYVYRHGPLRTADELAMIETIDYDKRLLLQRFVFVGDNVADSVPNLKHMLANGHHTLMLTGNIPMYEREGDKDGYLGYQYKHNIRYDFSYGDRLRFGLIGAQDAGEPFFANRNSCGYDFYSFYVVVKKIGRLKTLAVGRYRVEYGMGLVINNGFSLGKSYMLSTMGRTGNTIRPHSSTREGNYMQGAAATIDIGRGFEASAFVSYRDIDATLNGDSTIATIVTTGYHRTQTEMDKKHNARQTALGGNLRYVNKGFNIGLTAVYTTLSRDLQPKTTSIYRYYYAAGNNFYNIGLSYGYTKGRVSLGGETATGDCGAIATVNTGSLKVGSSLDLMLVQRFYSKRYYSLFARSFSEGGSVQNESGVYGGLRWQPVRKLTITAYTDYAYFPWPRYYTSSASHSWDNMLTLTYSPSQWSFFARYRYKMRERDTDEAPQMAYRREHKGRLYAAYKGTKWTSKTQVDLAFVSHVDNSKGWMVTQSIGYSPRSWLKFCGSAAYFHTDDYNSRLYNYERGMLYSYSNTAFYGEGIRYSLLVRCDLSRALMLQGKIGTTDYFDRSTIGSGYQQIMHSSKTDLELQLRWKIGQQ